MTVAVKGIKRSFLKDLWAQQSCLNARKPRCAAVYRVLDRKWSGCSSGREGPLSEKHSLILFFWTDVKLLASNYSPRLQFPSSSLKNMNISYICCYKTFYSLEIYISEFWASRPDWVCLWCKPKNNVLLDSAVCFCSWRSGLQLRLSLKLLWRSGGSLQSSLCWGIRE